MKILSLLAVLATPLFSLAQNSPKSDTLPPPYATKSAMNFSDVIGWDNGAMPIAPAGFTVTKYAEGFEHPRWLYVLPNGDVLVAESNSNYNLVEKIAGTIVGASKSNNLNKSADRISILRDVDKDGIPEVKQVFLENLAQPFGMLLLGNWLYVANTSSIYRVPYKTGDLKITAPGKKIVDLPAGKVNQHWTKNIIANAEGSKIYIAVGSGTNVAEKGLEAEVLRANILEMNPDGSGLRVYASGLRNPVGMDWAPGTKTLWTAVNERDLLGDDLVPDYLTSVQPNGFYGWPWMYWGQNPDPRLKERPEIAKKTIVPDVDLGAHTASLGLVFYNKNAFPEKYRNGAFVSQHGSWNRAVLSGYKVVFVPFKNGKPAGRPEDFLTGFIADLEKNKVRGRPVGLAILPDGSLLVCDDGTNIIWKVSPRK